MRLKIRDVEFDCLPIGDYLVDFFSKRGSQFGCRKSELNCTDICENFKA